MKIKYNGDGCYVLNLKRQGKIEWNKGEVHDVPLTHYLKWREKGVIKRRFASGVFEEISKDSKREEIEKRTKAAFEHSRKQKEKKLQEEKKEPPKKSGDLLEEIKSLNYKTAIKKLGELSPELLRRLAEEEHRPSVKKEIDRLLQEQ